MGWLQNDPGFLEILQAQLTPNQAWIPDPLIQPTPVTDCQVSPRNLGGGGTVLQWVLGFLAFVEMSLLSHLVRHAMLSSQGNCAINVVLEDAAPRNKVLDALISPSFAQKPDFHIQMNVTFLPAFFLFPNICICFVSAEFLPQMPTPQ